MPDWLSSRMMPKSRSLSAVDRAAVGSSMTISRALRTSARVMLISQFSAVESAFDVGGQRRADADAFGDRSDVARDGRPVDNAEPRLLGQAQHDVFQHRHAGHEGQLLVDETHAEFVGDVRRADCDAPPVDDDLAAVGLGQTRKDPDQRGLARAVRPDEAMDLAGNDRQRHPSQRLRAAEGLADGFAETRGDAAGVPVM